MDNMRSNATINIASGNKNMSENRIVSWIFKESARNSIKKLMRK